MGGISILLLRVTEDTQFCKCKGIPISQPGAFGAKASPYCSSILIGYCRWVLEDEELVDWFFDNGAQVDAVAQSPYEPSILDVAAAKASTVVFESLFNRGASKPKDIPLHMAAASGKNGERIPMMAYLIAAGYDVNAADHAREPWNRRRGTPLQYAVLAESLLNVEFLVRHGADPHNEGGVAVSAYTFAKRMELKDVIRLFQDPKVLH
ncbi:MAG: hypothetical protein Q9180_006860 [Flavoplaca navasiana]